MAYQKYIDLVDNSLSCIKEYWPQDYETRFLQLVEERRKLRKLQIAEYDNPAIAAFGKSQVGKSYLMSCILQDKGKPFMVSAGNKKYDFIYQINPIGDDKEATGVVTRFSSFKRHPEIYSKDYPVLVKTFSLVDVILVLSDSYYNDFSNFNTMSESEINEYVESVYKKYKEMPEIDSPQIKADDVLSIKDYFRRQINAAQTINHSNFFDKIALVIERIPVEDYLSVFSNLWYKDQNLNRLFNRLYDVLKRVNFSSYIYLPIEAVVHNGIKENTVMSVECLKHLYDTTSPCTTEVFVKTGNTFQSVGVMPKSDICAVCSEVVFKIEENFLSSSAQYCFDNIAPDVRAQLTQGDVKMSILRDNDLLDFPGARSREQENASKLSENTVLLNCFLRGKVAYLFNKYNESLAINILLYCHHNKDNDVTNLYKLLEEWVDTYVGKTAEQRKATLDSTDGISPLFYIGTMFNLDMAVSTNAVANTVSGIEGRWKGRFETVLFNQCFHRNTVDWVKNWIGKGVNFNNSYVLRDFKYSGDNASNLYEGFVEEGTETRMKLSETFYKNLRDTFINNESVKQLFANPALSWDVAASINNDGALYIIENLSKVAAKMMTTRKAQFADTLKDVAEKVAIIIKPYYVSDDQSEILESNICKAFGVQREFDFACQEDEYFFGHMLQALQITETECCNMIHKILPTLGEVTHSLDTEIIIDRLSSYTISNEEDFWKCFMRVYHFPKKNTAEEYLQKRQIDTGELIDVCVGKKVINKTNAHVIAEQIAAHWENRIKSIELMNAVTAGTQFDMIVLSDLLTNIEKVSRTLELVQSIEDAIAPYVNVMAINTVNESFVADIVATVINSFVMNFGYDKLGEKKIESSKKIAEREDLPIFNYIESERKISADDDELAAMFDTLITSGRALIPSFRDNYQTWLEYMFVSFIANLEMPDCDPVANKKLAEILEKLEITES